MTQATFDRCVSLMAEMWPQTAPSPKALAVYFSVLRDLDDSVFEAAVVACLRSCTFYPKPAELIAKAKDVLTATGALPVTGEQAWVEVLTAVRRDFHPDTGWNTRTVNGVSRIGGGTAALSELQQNALRALGGPGRLWNATDHELGFIRREFMDFYDHKRQCEIDYNPALLSQLLPKQLTESRP